MCDISSTSKDISLHVREYASLGSRTSSLIRIEILKKMYVWCHPTKLECHVSRIIKRQAWADAGS